MNLKKRKHFTPKKEDNFLMNCFFLCLSFQTRKDLVLVKFYDATVRRVFKTFRTFVGKTLSVIQNGSNLGCLRVRFLNTILWLLPNIEKKRIPQNDNIVWFKNSRIIKELSKSGRLSY